jgi:di/tricarboxylate transporter
VRGCVFGLLLALPFWAVIAAIVANSGGMWCFASATVAVTLIVCLLYLRHEDLGDD